MASHAAWLDRRQQERDALNYVHADRAVTVDVYRRPPQNGSPGLTTPTADHQHVGSIDVRIDVSRYRTRAETTTIRVVYIGLAADTDVRKDDLWRTTDIRGVIRWYCVTSTEPTQSMTRALLEEVKR